MKKIISLVIVAVMMLSAFAVTSSAEMYVQTDFTSMETLAQTFHAGAFYVEEEGILYGYNEAKCLQSKGEWYTYDTTIKVCLADDDLSEAHRTYELWYCNTNLENYGRFDGTNYMKFVYDIEEQQFRLGCADLKDDSQTAELAAPVAYELEDNKDHVFGMSISEKRIRCFVNDELIFDFVDEKNEYLIGIKDEFTIPTPLVFWNEGNFVQVKEVKIASPGSLYPFDMGNNDNGGNNDSNDGNVTTGGGNVTTNGGNNEADVTTTTRVTTTSQKVVEVTNAKGETVTDDKGEAVTSISIITEAPAPADTNTGKPNGGSSSSTGDATFVVIAAMVATLGCAVIVKKHNA